ncbi:hypothetical protein [Marilutibacter chinensis]|uniref:DUF3995 domain-containing protein n=1 Tax=Marilutibacter chinensis TaxID=2912247 RepID=A0ABS9HQU3_9GAMM|nr:hypothetical protein [Lysobacter chinensis]MCF7220677.1 hypothetical protein [Lysobacter chinensis]
MTTPRLARRCSALPDAVTAGFFALVWIAPQVPGAGAIRTGMLMMLVEFVLLHASAMIGSIALNASSSPRRKLTAVGGFAALYLLFIAAWAWQFRAWWPLVAFGWLVVGKAWLVMQPLPRQDRRQMMQSEWAIGVMAYLAGTFATVFLPIPRLGMDPAIVAEAALPGSGLWVSSPHTVIAFGVFYFGVLAVTKARGTRLKHAHIPGSDPD